MHVPVILEQAKDNGYRASVFAAAPLVVEGTSREQAIRKLRDMLSERLSGAELIQIEIPLEPQPDPWCAFAGVWRDHPDAAEVEENIRQYRREVNADPSRL